MFDRRRFAVGDVRPKRGYRGDGDSGRSSGGVDVGDRGSRGYGSSVLTHVMEASDITLIPAVVDVLGQGVTTREDGKRRVGDVLADLASAAAMARSSQRGMALRLLRIGDVSRTWSLDVLRRRVLPG